MDEKISIYVVCGLGLSSALLAEAMQEHADQQELPVEVTYISPDQMKDHADKCDVVLLSPQTRFSKDTIESYVEEKGVPVIAIPMQVYGLVQAEKAIELALEAYQRKRGEN
jgi:PTS system cellobiose-specific IIB component